MNIRQLPWPARLACALVLATAVGGLPGLVQAQDPKSSQFYEDALQRFQKKDYAGAILQLKNVLKHDARNLSAQVLLGRALVTNGEFGAAEVALNEALRLGANRVEVVVPLAQSLIGQARLQEVMSDARFAVAGLPPGQKAQMLLLQASISSDLSGARDALRLIEEARAIDPSQVDSWMAEVPVRIRGRQFKEAKAAAEKAVAVSGGSADTLYLLGSIDHAQGNAKGALATYEKALKKNPEHSETLIARAGLMVDQGKLDDALRDIAEVRRLTPSDPRAPYLAGQIASRQGDAKLAKSLMADVTGILDPVPIDFLRYKPQLMMLGGLAHFSLGQNEKARPYLESVVRQQANSPAAKLLGQIYQNAGNHDLAIETLEGYLKSHPRDANAIEVLATSNLAKGRAPRAVQLMQEALKIEDTPRLRTMLGMTLVGSGRRAEAVPEFENALKRDPGQVAAAAGLVSLYLGRNNTAKAIEVAEALIKRKPGDAQFQSMLGSARWQAGDKVKARAAFEQAIKLDPAFVPAQLQLAKLDMQGNQLDAAAKRLSDVLTKDPKHVEALIEMSTIMSRQKQPAEATKLLEKAADFSTGNELRPALLLVDHHLRAGAVDAATQAVGRLNGKAPDAVPVLLANASVKLAAGDVAAAQGFLTRAGRSAGTDAATLTQIATRQLAARDAKAAVFTLGKAVQAQPDFIPAKAMLVEANLQLGDHAAAEQVVGQVLARNPNGAQGQALKGDVALARGQVGAAIEAYKRAHQIEATPYSIRRLYVATARQDPGAAAQLVDRWLKTHPGDPELQRMAADGHARAGNFAAAKVAYAAVVAATPSDAEALNNYANVLLLTKDPAALKVAEQALARKPEAPHILGTAGWAAFQAGQGDRALQLLRDARLRDPANADTRYFLGSVLASLGRSAEARDELQGALALGRNFTYAKESEALLKTLK